MAVDHPAHHSEFRRWSGGVDRRICQTFAASPAEPGELPLGFSRWPNSGNVFEFSCGGWGAPVPGQCHPCRFSSPRLLICPLDQRSFIFWAGAARIRTRASSLSHGGRSEAVWSRSNRPGRTGARQRTEAAKGVGMNKTSILRAIKRGRISPRALRQLKAFSRSHSVDCSCRACV
jgi:hypothetical protein